MTVLTLNMADLWPLFLLLQDVLKFGAEGDVVGVVEHDAHNLTTQVLKPGHGYHLTELKDTNRDTCGSQKETLTESVTLLVPLFQFLSQTSFVSPPCL